MFVSLGSFEILYIFCISLLERYFWSDYKLYQPSKMNMIRATPLPASQRPVFVPPDTADGDKFLLSDDQLREHGITRKNGDRYIISRRDTTLDGRFHMLSESDRDDIADCYPLTDYIITKIPGNINPHVCFCELGECTSTLTPHNRMAVGAGSMLLSSSIAATKFNKNVFRPCVDPLADTFAEQLRYSCFHSVGIGGATSEDLLHIVEALFCEQKDACDENGEPIMKDGEVVKCFVTKKQYRKHFRSITIVAGGNIVNKIKK